MVTEQVREAAKQHVLGCVEQIMPRVMFQSLIESIPEHPAHFRDTHPIRMAYEAVRSRRNLSELRQYVLTRAYDWERLVIAWGFQRLLYEIARCDDEEGFCSCVGGRVERVPQYSPISLCLAGLLCLSGQWYASPDDELAADLPPPEKHLGEQGYAGPQPLT